MNNKELKEKLVKGFLTHLDTILDEIHDKGYKVESYNITDQYNSVYESLVLFYDTDRRLTIELKVPREKVS